MRLLSLFLGILLFLACVAVPLPGLDHNAPFSAHMLRHVLLLLVAAPLLAMAIPPANPARRGLTGLSRLTARAPLAPWLMGILVMWLSHFPDWYNALAGSAPGIVSCAPLDVTRLIHPGTGGGAAGGAAVRGLLNDMGLLLAGFCFSWPVVTPYPSFRLPPLRAILYLSSACVCCSLLGLLITFAPPGTYRGITMPDQQTGGLIMWVPCCFLYLSASMSLLIHWLSGNEGTSLFRYTTIRP
ncbi:MAG TPA: cytochrome c oxidase assembly protein [Puia sp.]|nr:cytochrome c oxidase assembly protein [Puia sp.]